ncbi:hypothetical protein ES705_18761 [subsurface metagenome]
MDKDLVYISEEKYNELKRSSIKEGDILIAKTGATIGKIGVFKRYDKAIISSSCLKLSLKNDINHDFFKYLLISDSGQSQILSEAAGSTRDTINIEPFSNLFFAMPKNDEQDNIVSFLDSKTSQINQTIEKDKQLIELLKEKRTALINHAVTKGLDPNVKLKDSGIDWIGEIPEGWDVIKLKFIADERKEKERDGKEKHLLGLENIESSTTKIIEYNSTENIEGESLKFEKNDVLFGKLRPYLAKVTLVDRVGCCTSEIIVYKSTKKILPKFLMYKLVSKKYIDYINSLTYGVKMPRADPNTLSNIKQSVPPFEEQRKIAQYLNKATSKIDKTIQKIEEKIKLLEEYKKSLIHHVVTGKVDVRGVEA